MRHRVYGAHLSRSKNQRTALFRSLVRSLFLNEKIETSEAKAKAIRGLVDKLITQAKSPNTRRLVSQFLTDQVVAEKLVSDIAPRLSDRVSGYTSIVKLGVRPGDGTMMVAMKLLTTELTANSKPQFASKQVVNKKAVSGEHSSFTNKRKADRK